MCDPTAFSNAAALPFRILQTFSFQLENKLQGKISQQGNITELEKVERHAISLEPGVAF